MATTPTTSVATINGVTYTALANVDPIEFKRSLEENTGGEGISVFDLDRITIPTGGGLTWQIPSAEGRPTPKEAIEGIIVMWRSVRAYWPGKLVGLGTPPSCTSDDGETGHGDPGGSCDACQFAEFGSKLGDDGRPGPGQACKAMRQLFILDPDSLLPSMISLPATSIKPMRRYMMQLTKHADLYYGVVTSIGLDQARSQNGIAYAVAAPRLVTRLDGPQRAAVKAYADAIRSTLLKVAAVDARDWAAEDVID